MKDLRVYISSAVNETEGDKFYNAPIIQRHVTSAPVFQVHAVNTYFRNKLLALSGETGKDVNEILYLIVDDPDADQWYNLMVSTVIGEFIEIGLFTV
jgi:hypothetical protein